MVATESGSGCDSANFDRITTNVGQCLNGLGVQHHRRSTELVHALNLTRDWFEHHSWTPLPFQKAISRAYLEGRSGLIQGTYGEARFRGQRPAVY